MTFLPIVWRELRLASRRRATYWLRSGAALSMVAVGTWIFLMFRGEPPKDLAVGLFGLLTGGAVLFALLSGPRSTADCISEEKREGTLGLLFLTDLKGYDVVLGKLVAGSLNAFYTVFAMLPMLAIPLLLGGGITLPEFGRMALVTINALFFSLTLGICVSSMSRSAHKAAAGTLLLVLLFTAASPACGALIAAAHKTPKVNPLFLAPSVGFTFYQAFDAPYKIAKSWFWTSLGVVQGISWVGLILASLITPAVWKERPLSKTLSAAREHWRAWTFGNSTQRSAFRCRLLDINPVYWLVARARGKTATVWMFLLLAGLAWLWGWWRFRQEWLNEGVYVTTGILLNLTLRYWLAGEAARPLAENRKSGALELLLSTPLKVHDILHGHWLALRRQFLGPVVAVLFVESLFMFATTKETVPDEERVFWFALWIAGMLMLLADLVALYWIGMWQGLTARNPVRAAGASLMRVMVVPWVVYGSVVLLLALMELTTRSYNTPPSWKFFLGLWFALGIGADLLFGITAWQKLISQFRLTAQQLYGKRSPVWKRLFGSLGPEISRVEPGHLGSQTGT